MRAALGDQTPILGGSSGDNAVKGAWRPWSVDGAVAGNVIEYDVGDVGDVGGAGQFLFATVRGAGHMAPTFQPRSAQVMIARFVNGTAL